MGIRNIVLGLVVLAVIGFALSSKSAPAVDLNQVGDRTVQAMAVYEQALEQRGVERVADEHLAEFTGLMTAAMNTDPRFFEKAIGVQLLHDATLEGWADENVNQQKDEGEGRIFTAEIDTENRRIILTDANGTAVGHHIPGTGIMAGMLIGSMLSRQNAAGIRPGSFNTRRVASSADYARSRVRSGGPSRGK